VWCGGGWRVWLCDLVWWGVGGWVVEQGSGVFFVGGGGVGFWLGVLVVWVCWFGWLFWWCGVLGCFFVGFVQVVWILWCWGRVAGFCFGICVLGCVGEYMGYVGGDWLGVGFFWVVRGGDWVIGGWLILVVGRWVVWGLFFWDMDLPCFLFGVLGVCYVLVVVWWGCGGGGWLGWVVWGRVFFLGYSWVYWIGCGWIVGVGVVLVLIGVSSLCVFEGLEF